MMIASSAQDHPSPRSLAQCCLILAPRSALLHRMTAPLCRALPHRTAPPFTGDPKGQAAWGYCFVLPTANLRIVDRSARPQIQYRTRERPAVRRLGAVPPLIHTHTPPARPLPPNTWPIRDADAPPALTTSWAQGNAYATCILGIWKSALDRARNRDAGVSS